MSKVDTTSQHGNAETIIYLVQPRDRRRTARNAFVQLPRQLHTAPTTTEQNATTWSRLGDISLSPAPAAAAAAAPPAATARGGDLAVVAHHDRRERTARLHTCAAGVACRRLRFGCYLAVNTNPGGSSWSIGPEGVSPSKRGGQAWPRGPLELLGPDIYRFRIGFRDHFAFHPRKKPNEAQYISPQRGPASSRSRQL